MSLMHRLLSDTFRDLLKIVFAFRFRVDKRLTIRSFQPPRQRLALDSQPKENAIIIGAARTDMLFAFEFITDRHHTAFSEALSRVAVGFHQILLFIIPQIKQASSRATAALATFELLLNAILMYFLRSRSFALSA